LSRFSSWNHSIYKILCMLDYRNTPHHHHHRCQMGNCQNDADKRLIKSSFRYLMPVFKAFFCEHWSHPDEGEKLAKSAINSVGVRLRLFRFCFCTRNLIAF
jgi:hypothetical protein